MKPSTGRHVDGRGARIHVRSWGDASAPPLVLLHGWMDCSAAFQFVVDALARPWHVLALDWRGHGLSAHAPDGIYTYFDHLADLDCVLDAIAPDGRLRIAGHSLGGNMASLYAAARPERVEAIALIDSFGLRARTSADRPQHFAHWLAELRRPNAWRPSDDFEGIVKRVRELSPRATEARVRFIAEHWSERLPDGRWRLRADPRLRRPNAELQRLDDMLAIWGAIEAPVLWIQARQTENLARHHIDAAAHAERRAAVKRLRFEQVEDCGHMVHWDQPEALARLLEGFFVEPGGAA